MLLVLLLLLLLFVVFAARRGFDPVLRYDDDWFTYFFNSSNHKAGIKPPSYVTYHFYAIPGDLPDIDPWPTLNTDPVSLWPIHLFRQAAQFVQRAEHINGVIRAASFGGRNVKIYQDEVGIIGGRHCPTRTLFTSDSDFWNIAASLWGYYYGELARLGSEAIAASQLTGYPKATWNIHGAPVNNNFPCVSMMDWRGNGSDTARTWALQMTIDILGNDEKRVFPTAPPVPVSTPAPSATAPSGGGPAAWPLPSTVYSIGFVLASGKKVILLSNTNSSAATANVAYATGGTIHTVDSVSGHGDVPYSSDKVLSDEIKLRPSAFALIELR